MLRQTILRNSVSSFTSVTSGFSKLRVATRFASSYVQIPKSRVTSAILDHIRNPLWQDKVAIVDTEIQQQVTYRELDTFSNILAHKILLHEAQHPVQSTFSSIGAFHKPGLPFTLAMLATWKLQRTFVPLCATHSYDELLHVITDSGITTLICHQATGITDARVRQEYANRVLESNQIAFANETNLKSPVDLLHLHRKNNCSTANSKENALVIYTSGTTGRPKGVLHTHSSVDAMCQSVTTAWDYRVTDRILNFLPLYHVHGLLNKLLCVLRVGGTVEFVPSAQAAALWHRLAQETLNDKGSTGSAPSEGTITKENTSIKSDKLTMFMAVPTVYAKMLEYANTAGSKEPIKSQVIAPALHCLQHQLRLMVSGSAALPDSLMYAWKALTTQTLLERYGMTEIGMALTNPYSPVSERKTGFVGKPFPFVQVRLVEEETTTHAAGQRVIADANIPGELQIAGATVFKEYLNRPDATQESFVYADEEESAGDDSAKKERSLVRWFRTGDIAERDATGDYRILGRASADILKSSGYKISALEIERVLLSHPLVLEVAVCARPNDPLVGDRIVAIVALREPTNAASTSTTASAGTVKQKKERQAVLEEYMRSQLAKYKHPHEWIFLQTALPRNHMGKVNKKSLLKDVQSLPQLS